MNDSKKTRKVIWNHTPIGLKLTGSAVILLIVLKLCGIQPMAGWSWLWLLSPFWIIGALSIVLFLGMFLIFYLFDR